MFTTPCFIRKNTPELRLREKLEELGYSQVKQSIYYDSIMVENGKIWLCLNIFNPEKADGRGWDKCIDCGTNEELFLAIAALRDDSDYMQWFTDGSDDFWFKCGDEMCNENTEYYQQCYDKQIHKATVNELIEHFK